MNTCPDCKCQFVQPFKCITCGAEQLYDATVRSQATRITLLESALVALWKETKLSGNDNAKDYGWPKVKALVLAALPVDGEADAKS